MPTYDLLLVKIIVVTFYKNEKVFSTLKAIDLFEIINVIDKIFNLLDIIELAL